jgi:general secretion pathway protein F
MPIYSYRGIDKFGKDVKGSINVDSENAAKARVRQMGIMLVGLALQKSGVEIKGASSGKVRIEDLAIMTRQLSTLIKAKIQIVEALSALIDQVDNANLRIVLSEIKQKVNEGSSLAKALTDYPKVFNQVYVNMVEAGEASGTLDIVLNRLAEFTDAQTKLKSKIVGAMLYPIIIATIGFVMMMIIFIFVIPKITKIFETMKKEIPIQTRICMAISNGIQEYWHIIIVSIFSLVFIFRKYINSPGGKRRWHSFLLRAPIVKKLIVMIDVSRFCSTLATLLNSGVPIIVAMKIVKNLITNLYIQDAVEKSKSDVSEGKSIAGPLIDSGLFPPMVTHMINLGQRSGELEPMLNIVAESYVNEIDTQLGRITALLMPLMMVLLGGAVFFVVLSVILPIMELNSIRR